MSGGVDSAVAAARAAEAGHDVTGIHLALSRNPQSYRTGARGCCTIEDANDARRAADVIGIPFYVWDLSDRFHEDVVEDFIARVRRRPHPEPLPALQREDQVRRRARPRRGARLRRGGHRPLRAAASPATDGTVEMHRAVDMGKDQSYVLGVLTQEQLRALAVPARRLPQGRGARGGRAPRAAGRAEAGQPRHLLHRRRRHRRLAAREARRRRSGDIVDHASGEVLGSHDGAYGFTIGQRKGLRIGRPAADGRPRFVLDIEPVSGTVTVGPREELTVDRIEGIRPRWCGAAPVDAAARHGAAARARRRAPRRRDAARRRRRRLVELLDPAQGIAPGQAAVVYDGTRVVGSCTIRSARRTPARGMIRATGVGSMPGDDAEDYDLAVKVVLDELPDLPHVPGAARVAGAHADMTGRALAVVAELGADLQPAGWRLTGTQRGVDHRRARSLLAQDLDVGRGAQPGLRRSVQDPGRRTVDAGRDRRAAPRRPGARRPRRPPRARPGARRGAARPRRRRAAPDPGGARSSCRSTSRRSRRCSPAGCRRPPASTGTAPSTRPAPALLWSGCSRP